MISILLQAMKALIALSVLVAVAVSSVVVVGGGVTVTESVYVKQDQPISLGFDAGGAPSFYRFDVVQIC